MRFLLRLFWTHRRGNAATEFAFILPIMLAFIAGVVEFGRAFVAYDAVNRLATRYAITYSDCYDIPAGTCDNNAGHELAWLSSSAAVQNLAPQLTPSALQAPRIFRVLMSNATPPVPSVVYGSVSGSLTSIEIAQTQVQISPGQYAIGPGQYGVVVTVSYQHNVLFFKQLMAPLLRDSPSVAYRTISYTVAQRNN